MSSVGDKNKASHASSSAGSRSTGPPGTGNGQSTTSPLRLSISSVFPKSTSSRISLETQLDKQIPICSGREVQQYSNIGFAVNPNDSIFKEIDTDKDGYISLPELENGLKNTGIPVSKTEVVKFFNSIDRDGDGYISLKEFKRFCTKRQNGKLTPIHTL